MKIFFEKLVKYFLVASFFTPLFFLPSIWSRFIFPFVVPKILFFRTTVLLMLGAYLILLFIDAKKYKIKNTPLTVTVLGFLASFALSTFFGVDWYKSFWDNHERMLGLFTVTHYVLLYLISTTVIRTQEEWRVLWKWFLAIGSVVMLIGAWQKVSPDFFLNQKNVRVSGTLGNAIYFAGFGLFLGFAGLLLGVQEKVKSWKIVFFILGALGFWGIFLSSTRGTLLGLLVGSFVTLVLCFFHFRKNTKVKRIFLGVLLSGGLIVAILFAFRDTLTVRSIPAVGRLLNSGQEIREKSPRLMAWGIAVESWKERPIFGWGPNNYYYSFNKYYRPEFLNFSAGETWFDNAHNVILNTLAVQGALGLGLYVALFVTSIIMLWKKYKAGSLEPSIVFLSIGFLIAHFVHNIFVFEDPTSYLTFFFFLAFINAISSDFSSPESKGKEKKVSLVTLGAVGIGVCILIFITDIKPAQANMAAFKTLQSFYNGQTPVENYKKTVTIASPHIDDIRNDFARILTVLIPEYLKANRQTEATELFNLSYADIKKNVELHPLDVRVLLQQAQLSQVGAQYFNRPELFEEGEKALTQAFEISPKRQQVNYMLSLFDLQLGNAQKSEKILLDTIDQNPSIEESWWRLAFVYAQLGQKQKMLDIYAQAEKQGVVIPQDKKDLINNVLNQAQVKNTTSKSK